MLRTVEKARERTDWSVARILAQLGLKPGRYYEWVRRRDRNRLEDRPSLPLSLEELLEEEVEAIKRYALGHPKDGYRRLAWMMVDEDVAYVSPSSVYKVLRAANLLCRWKPRDGTGPGRIPSPERPHERWHMDLMYLWVGGRWYFLVCVLDGYSRYIVHWELLMSMRAEETRDVAQRALELYPGEHPAIVSDNGSQFTSREFRKLVKRLLLEHIHIRRQHPESNGRLERFHRSTREALSEVETEDYYAAREAIRQWVEYYNQERLHAGIQYLRPVDYFAGNPEARLSERGAKLDSGRAHRRRQNAARRRMLEEAPSRPPQVGEAPAWDASTASTVAAGGTVNCESAEETAGPSEGTAQPSCCVSGEVAGRLPADGYPNVTAPQEQD